MNLIISIQKTEFRSIYIHYNLHNEEAQSKSLEDFKNEMISIFMKSYEYFDKKNVQEKYISDCHKCFFKRSNDVSCEYDLIDEKDIHNIIDLQELVFVLTEGSEPLEELSSLVHESTSFPYKFCFVFNPLQVHLPNKDFWCIDESYSVGFMLSNLKETYSELFLKDSIHFQIYRSNEMPRDQTTATTATIYDTNVRRNLKGKLYNVYKIKIKNENSVWMVEHRYSDFEKLHKILLNQNPQEIGKPF